MSLQPSSLPPGFTAFFGIINRLDHSQQEIRDPLKYRPTAT
jgi:hypothetical protein